MSSQKLYFITIAKPESHGWIKAGEICYIHEAQYIYQESLGKSTIPVKCMSSFVEHDLPFDILQSLSKEQVELLLALDGHKERLEAVLQSESLDQAVNLVKESKVLVEQKGEWLRGVVKYIGRLSEPIRGSVAGVFFGVELQGEDRGKGQNDGKYIFKTFFKCPKDCDIFVPFTKIKPVHSKTPGPPQARMSDQPETNTEELFEGDRVIYFIADKAHHGMVLNVEKDKGMVLISTDKDEKGREGGEIKISLQHVIKENDETEKMDISESPAMAKSLEAAGIRLNSVVKLQLAKGSVSGTVRWIGYLLEFDEFRVGLELKEDVGVSDGTFKGVRYFTCPPKRGLFVKPSSCRLDAHAQDDTTLNGHFDHKQQYLLAAQENVPPIRSEDVKVLIGKMKGIQGHCNSCYMDSALFSLFSCSSVLDSLLYKSPVKNGEAIQKTLLREIVSPLRSKGFVKDHSVMKLRQQLQARGHSPSYTTDEKDPEEFLTLIMQEILSLDPPLKLQTFGMGKEETSYFYQIFVDYDNSLVLPTVQQLLEHSFYNSGLRLAEVPACLILTMPRFGKQFKMFPKIIPSLELDITDLLSNGPQQCVLCGQLAHVECTECFRDSLFSNTGFKHFCEKCSVQVHLHPCRNSHKPMTLRVPEGFRRPGGPLRTPPREKLELFAVLCIETSHYVSFVKHGPKTTDWIFFDSMADRIGDIDGYNIPEVKECPEVARYLTMSLAELAKQVPREMEGVAKRLFCDGYMYLYQSPNMALYH